MKARLFILIAAGIFFTTATKAQYGAPCADPRYGYQSSGFVNYNYNNYARDRYNDQRGWRDVEYDRYCRDHREYRGDRRAYYQERVYVHPAPFWAPRRVVVVRY